MRRSAIFRRLDALLAVAVLASPAAAFATDCPAAGSVYHMGSDPQGKRAQIALLTGVEAADLELALLAPELDQPEVFALLLPQESNVVTAIASGPLMNRVDLPASFFADGPRGRLVPYKAVLPKADSPAPAAFYVSGMAPLLWYASSQTKRPVRLPDEIWYLATCG